MRYTLILILAACLCGNAMAADPIDHLVASLSATHGLWVNGITASIDLPKTASTEQVLDAVFKQETAYKGHSSTYKIVKIRQVHITGPQPDLYTAVLVTTPDGDKIVLLQYTGPVLGWWNRIYDPKTEAWH